VGFFTLVQEINRRGAGNEPGHGGIDFQITALQKRFGHHIPRRDLVPDSSCSSPFVDGRKKCVRYSEQGSSLHVGIDTEKRPSPMESHETKPLIR
jgi:hypothetical protein